MTNRYVSTAAVPKKTHVTSHRLSIRTTIGATRLAMAPMQGVGRPRSPSSHVGDGGSARAVTISLSLSLSLPHASTILNRAVNASAKPPAKRNYNSLGFLCLSRKNFLVLQRGIGVPTIQPDDASPQASPSDLRRRNGNERISSCLRHLFLSKVSSSYLLRARPRESRHISERRGISWNQALLLYLFPFGCSERKKEEERQKVKDLEREKRGVHIQKPCLQSKKTGCQPTAQTASMATRQTLHHHIPPSTRYQMSFKLSVSLALHAAPPLYPTMLQTFLPQKKS